MKYEIYVNNTKVFWTDDKAKANKQYIQFRRIYFRCNVRMVEN